MSFFEDASLVLIPSAQKTSKIYSIKPTDGTGDLTFTRINDTATRVNSSGLIEKVRTNLQTYSQDFSATGGWGGDPITATKNYGTAPDGTQTSTRLQFSSANYVWQQSVTGINGNLGVFSLYIKGTAGETIQIAYGGTDKLVTIGTGWTRVNTNGTVASTGTININTYGGNARDFEVWGGQTELGDIATDYIATTSAAVSVGPVANVPRLDYLGSSCPRLLLEPQRTNLVTSSERFDAMSLSNLTVTANNATSPDGYTNADRLTPSGSGFHTIGNFISVTAGTPYTISFFYKNFDHKNIGFYDNNTSGSEISINVENNTYTLGANVTAGGIISYGNGWYRAYATFSPSTSTMNNLIIFRDSTNNGNYTATGSYIWAYGWQVEAGAYATSYIPTLGAAVTRGADFQSNSDVMGTSYSSNDFTYFIEFDLLHDSASRSPMLFGGGNQVLGPSYQGYLRIGLFGNDSIALFGHGDTLMASVVNPLTKGTRYKFLIKRSGTSIKFYLNGAQIGSTGTSSVGFTLRSIGWGYAAGSYNTEGNIYQFLAFESAISDADAITLTTI